VELTLGGDPGHAGAHLSLLQGIGHVTEVREEASHDGPASRARLVVEDAEAALPKVFEALGSAGAELRGARVLDPSFDEVFFRLVGDRH
jgi:hypothetical protein